MRLKGDVTKKETGTTPLAMACQSGYKDVVELLLKYGADVNKPNPIDGSTTLFLAAQEGHTGKPFSKKNLFLILSKEIVSLLLKHRADVNIVCTDDGTSPLFIRYFFQTSFGFSE